MHLFKVTADDQTSAMVVAADAEDAKLVYRQEMEDESVLVVVQMLDEQSITIPDDDGRPDYRTAVEWTALGRGVLASTEH